MDLARELVDARRRTLDLAIDLDDARWIGPRLAVVNPTAWEIGHVAWFAELWTLRHARGRAPLRLDGDALWDSARVPHDARWTLPLPDRAGLLAYLDASLTRVLEALGDARSPYWHLLALFHEDMHGEALTYTRQTLADPAPPFLRDVAPPRPAGPLPGDVEVPGGRFRLGPPPAASRSSSTTRNGRTRSTSRRSASRARP